MDLPRLNPIEEAQHGVDRALGPQHQLLGLVEGGWREACATDSPWRHHPAPPTRFSNPCSVFLKRATYRIEHSNMSLSYRCSVYVVSFSEMSPSREKWYLYISCTWCMELLKHRVQYETVEVVGYQPPKNENWRRKYCADLSIFFYSTNLSLNLHAHIAMLNFWKIPFAPKSRSGTGHGTSQGGRGCEQNWHSM